MCLKQNENEIPAQPYTLLLVSKTQAELIHSLLYPIILDHSGKEWNGGMTMYYMLSKL